MFPRMSALSGHLIRMAALSLAVLLAVSACSGAGSSRRASGSGSGAHLPKAPPPQPPPQLTKKKVDAALAKLDGVVHNVMRRTGVPGISVAVVYRDKVVYLKGFGVRQVGKPAKVGPDSVFQLASVSKPLASTVVAGVVGQKVVSWDDPVAKYDRGFRLKDRWVSKHVTLADLFSHRSGLPDHAGDLLEDLGYGRRYVLGHLRYEPLAPFRASYAYTNFGLTEAAVAVAEAKHMSWAKLSDDVLYRPLGMTSTSSRFADYQSASNKAVGHVEINGTWRAKYTRDPEAQSPAGGASSTARDMAQWLRLQLADGKLGGRRIIPAAGLEETHLPQIMSNPPRAPAGRADFYGLGWNVSYDNQGRLRLSHSGAFELGAATNVTLLPSERLGIVVLTNAAPVGAPETIANDFFDIAQSGHPSVDWLGLFAHVFAVMEQSQKSKIVASKPPAHATPARPNRAYVGTYSNKFYGPLRVRVIRGKLAMQLGPRHMIFDLQHYDGNVFSYQTRGENAVGPSGVTFSVAAGRATKLTVENLDETGLGTFTRR